MAWSKSRCRQWADPRMTWAVARSRSDRPLESISRVQAGIARWSASTALHNRQSRSLSASTPQGRDASNNTIKDHLMTNLHAFVATKPQDYLRGNVQSRVLMDIA